LLDHAEANQWMVIVADRDEALAQRRVGNHSYGKAESFDASIVERRQALVQAADLIISMLPATMHIELAKDALLFGKHLITPSYVSKDMRALDAEAREKGLLFLNEMGVDPGIDHMSAMKIINDLKAEGAKIVRFESFTGGLVAPESDNNPWHYKFTWNPRNVVMAGQGGTAQYLQNGRLKYIPIHKIFHRYKVIDVPGYGSFQGYANRDSLSYRKVYGIEDVPTIYRGTLRGEGFCEAWSVFVQLGITTEDFEVECADMTYRDFLNAFLMYDEVLPVEEKLRNYLKLTEEVMDKLTWLGIFETRKIGLERATPAAILQKLLEEKWALAVDDKDMIVMWHRFDYLKAGVEHEMHSSMVFIGRDQTYTAMSDTVGLPVAIAAKMILENRIHEVGVHLPILPGIYEPILEELRLHGIDFQETLIR